MSNMPDTEPCPRCGGTDIRCRLDNGKWQNVCEACGYGATLWYASAQRALDYWNENARRGRAAERKK